LSDNCVAGESRQLVALCGTDGSLGYFTAATRQPLRPSSYSLSLETSISARC